MRCLFCSYVTFAALGCAYAQNDVLAPGNPPLTATMVDQRIWVVETFLNIHLTPDQRDRFSRALADDWRTRDKQQIEYTLSDLKYYGKDADLKKMAATGLDAYVDNLRNHPDDPLNSVLLEAFDAAHPDRKDVMRPRGLGHLLGKWGGGDAMVGDRDPFTGRAMGVSFTDGLTLTIFSDGRFVHGWAHRHCSGAACCQEYGTMASGTIEVEGTTLTLNAESGLRMSRGNCVPMNVSERMSPKREVFQYSMRVQKPQNVPLLCLSSHPFQFNEKVAAQPSAMRRSEPLNSCPA